MKKLFLLSAILFLSLTTFAQTVETHCPITLCNPTSTEITANIYAINQTGTLITDISTAVVPAMVCLYYPTLYVPRTYGKAIVSIITQTGTQTVIRSYQIDAANTQGYRFEWGDNHEYNIIPTL